MDTNTLAGALSKSSGMNWGDQEMERPTSAQSHIGPQGHRISREMASEQDAIMAFTRYLRQGVRELREEGNQ